MFNYTIAYQLAQHVSQPLRLKEEITVAGGKLREENGKLLGEIQLSEENDEKAIRRATEIANIVAHSFALLNNIGLRVQDLAIKSRVASDERGVSIGLYASIKASATVFVTIGKESEAELAKYVEALNRVSPETRVLIDRALHWFSRALLDEDPIDRFVGFCVGLEILGEVYFHSDTVTKRIQKLVEKFSEDSVRGKDITAFRGALLHSGQKIEDVEKYARVTNPIIRKAFQALLNVSAG